jgi:hypothetical protein
MKTEEPFNVKKFLKQEEKWKRFVRASAKNALRCRHQWFQEEEQKYGKTKAVSLFCHICETRIATGDIAKLVQYGVIPPRILKIANADSSCSMPTRFPRLRKWLLRKLYVSITKKSKTVREAYQVWLKKTQRGHSKKRLKKFKRLLQIQSSRS